MPKTEPFEKHSDQYDEWFEKNRDVYHAEIEAIRQMIPCPEAKGMEIRGTPYRIPTIKCTG